VVVAGEGAEVEEAVAHGGVGDRARQRMTVEQVPAYAVQAQDAQIGHRGYPQQVAEAVLQRTFGDAGMGADIDDRGIVPVLDAAVHVVARPAHDGDLAPARPAIDAGAVNSRTGAAKDQQGIVQRRPAQGAVMRHRRRPPPEQFEQGVQGVDEGAAARRLQCQEPVGGLLPAAGIECAQPGQEFLLIQDDIESPGRAGHIDVELRAAGQQKDAAVVRQALLQEPAVRARFHGDRDRAPAIGHAAALVHRALVRLAADAGAGQSELRDAAAEGSAVDLAALDLQPVLGAGLGRGVGQRPVVEGHRRRLCGLVDPRGYHHRPL